MFLVRVMLFGAILGAPLLKPTIGSADEKHEIIKRLSHQENLIRSIQYKMTITENPTRRAVVDAIRRVCAIQKRPTDADSYIIDDAHAQRTSCIAHCWHQGEKERIEVLYPAKGMRNITAFDGTIIRTLATHAQDVPTGSIHTKDSADWDQDNRLSLMYILYRYFSRPYSSVIRDASDVQLTTVHADGSAYARISVRDRSSIVSMTFDATGRVHDREILVKRSVDRDFRLNERHRFRDYAAIVDPSGETIWYPTSAEITYYMGVDEEGTPVDYRSTLISISDIKYNEYIDDELFRLEFPQNAEVWDGVYALGWLAEDVDPENPFAMKAPSWKIALAVTVAICLLVLAFKLIRHSGSNTENTATV